jgi:hypothetical protein
VTKTLDAILSELLDELQPNFWMNFSQTFGRISTKLSDELQPNFR